MKSVMSFLGVSVFVSSLLAGCSGEPEWVAVYEECKQRVNDAAAQSMAQAEGEEDAQTRAMRESMNNMAMGMAMGACEMIKGACEEDPEGDVCQAYIQKR